MFRTVKIAVAVLVAAAIAVPTALAKQGPVDPLAISVLKGRGWSASQIYDWTRGACSYQVKPASCYLTPAEARLASQRLAESMHGPLTDASTTVTTPKPVDPLAVSMLRGRGWSSSRIYDWTQGACSDQVKPASCYLTAAEARLASQRLAESMHGVAFRSSNSPTAATSDGFDWGDGLMGAGVTAGIFIFGAAGALGLSRRRAPVHR